MCETATAKIEIFFSTWLNGGEMKDLCRALYTHIRNLPGTTVEFVARPGVSFSFRMLKGPEHDIAALLDVIDDDPHERWISLCFPNAIVTDSKEEGDLVPQGLNGKDARCFTIDTLQADTLAYMKTRLVEAAF